MRSLALALGLSFAAALPLAAAATPVTVQISGVWDVVDDGGGVVSPPVGVGTAFTATMNYDDSAPLTFSDPTTANYDLGALPFSLVIQTGGFTFTRLASGFTSFDLVNDVFDTAGGLFNDFSGAPGLPPIGFSYASLSLDDPGGNALSSTALVGFPWSLASWPTAGLGLFFDVDDANPSTYVDLQGTITELTVVPEPGALALLAGGLALLAAGARRRA